MKLHILTKTISLISCLSLQAFNLAHAATVPANDANIHYSGRIDDSNTEAVRLSYSGTRVRMAFEGESVGAYVDDLHQSNWIVVYIDGQRTAKLSIDGTGGYYELASDLDSGPHTIEIIKATEGNVGNLRFNGFELADNGNTLPWPAQQDRRIEFIGDSITCGYGIEAPDQTHGFDPDEENFCDTYAFHTAQNLNADYLVVARSGIGMLRNYNGPVDGSNDNMPAIYDRTLLKSAEPKWDSTRFTPDVVCINLCTNDFSTTGPNEDKFESNYTEFVHRIQTQYPRAKIVLLLGPMTNEAKIRTLLKRIAANTSSESNPVSFFELSAHGKYGFGAHYHPSRKQAEVNGAELSAYLGELMDWKPIPSTTHNLLQSPLTVAQIADILERTADSSALPSLGDPQWAALRTNPFVQHWATPLIARAVAQANQPLPPLTKALYQDFYRNGTRLAFESIYYERRRQLCQAAIALLLVDDAPTYDLLLPSFLNKLNDVLDESSWSLPAHIGTPSGKDPLMIDLFAAETANNFAEMLVVFNSVIPAELATRIQNRLHTQIFENYVNRDPAFGWTSVSNNWNAVCHQGVLGAALAIEDDHELVARIIVKTAAALPLYLAGFGDDGSTSEGPGYWSYGFGWFSALNAQLEQRTAGQLSFFGNEPKIARIARFAPQMTLSQGHLVNFSDSSSKGILNPALLSYLGQRLNDPILQQQSVAFYQYQTTNPFNLDAMRRDFFNLSRLALYAPTADTPIQATTKQQPDAYFPDYGAIVARGTDSQGHLWEFAAKAGHNDEHHNHNDCGSWLLNIDGTPCLLEIGAPEYTQAVFKDATRYTFLAARSLGHSVPFVNGYEQAVGREFAAKVLHADVGNDRVEFEIDLTASYPPEAGCQKLHRHWVLDKTAGTLTITDSYELKQAGPFESILIALPSTTREADDAIVTMGTTRIRIQPRTGTQITAIETCEYRGHHGTDETVARIRLAASEETASGTLTYTLRIDE